MNKNDMTHHAQGAAPTRPKSTVRLLERLRTDPVYRRRLLITACLVALLIVAILAAMVTARAVLPGDVWATRELQEHPLTQVLDAVSIFGNGVWAVVTIAVGAVVVGLWLGLRAGLFLVGGTLVQGLVNIALKHAIGRPRPVSTLVDVIVPEQGASFPSGHVMFYTVFFGFLTFLVWNHVAALRARWALSGVLLVPVALIGASRMVLGAHWISDVIAAYLLGGVLLIGVIAGYDRWSARIADA